ncbi:MAG: hypothetical protein K6F05_02000, partial [Succinivibrio sp.]|nr:hypothetical protein [Succinivibrio sp.]
MEGMSESREQEHSLRRYGKSKEHRPNPCVQMGLFMDGDGMPLGFCINPGNTNEQVTMRPLEQELIRHFGNKGQGKSTLRQLSKIGNSARLQFSLKANRSTYILKILMRFNRWIGCAICCLAFACGSVAQAQQTEYLGGLSPDAALEYIK